MERQQFRAGNFIGLIFMARQGQNIQDKPRYVTHVDNPHLAVTHGHEEPVLLHDGTGHV